VPLSTAFPALTVQLVAAFEAAELAGELSLNNTVVRFALSSAMAVAIKNYYTQALVTTKGYVDPSQPDLLGGRTSIKRNCQGTGILVEAGGVSNLRKSIDTALEAAETAGQEDDNSDQVIADLAEAMAKAVHKYFTSVKVVTTVIIPSGGNSVGSPAATAKPIANITSPGAATGSGKVKFPMTVPTVANPILYAGCRAAYEAAREAGTQGAGVPATVAILAAGLSAAFHAYTKFAVVETSVTVPGGQVVVGYQMLVPGGPPAPLPPTVTGPWKGDAEGKLS